MQKQPFSKLFTVEAESKEQSEKIFNALWNLYRVSETNDLLAISAKVTAKPALIKRALKFI